MIYLIGFIVSLFVLMIFHFYQMKRLYLISSYNKKANEAINFILSAEDFFKGISSESVIKGKFYKIELVKDNKTKAIKELIKMFEDVNLLYERVSRYSLDEDEFEMIDELSMEIEYLYIKLNKVLWLENGV